MDDRHAPSLGGEKPENIIRRPGMVPRKGNEFMRSPRSLLFIVGGLLLAGVATAIVLRWFDNPPPVQIGEEAVGHP